MILYDDNTAPNLDTATSLQTENEQVPASETGSVQTAEIPQPTPLTATEEKPPSIPPPDDFAAALESFTTEVEEQQASEDHVLKGTVLKLTPTHVVVDIGAKSEGMLPIAEVLDHEGNARVKPGDEIDVMREKGETEEGYINLSHQKAQRLRAWDEIEHAYSEKKPIRAVVVDRIKGGLTVDILGARAFLPGSQVDLRPVRNLDGLKGLSLEGAVI